MPLRYKIDVIAALKDKGYSTYKIQKDKLLSQTTLQKFRLGKGVAWENIETVCRLLECQPSDFMEYVAEPTDETAEGAE